MHSAIALVGGGTKYWQLVSVRKTGKDRAKFDKNNKHNCDQAGSLCPADGEDTEWEAKLLKT